MITFTDEKIKAFYDAIQVPKDVGEDLYRHSRSSKLKVQMDDRGLRDDDEPVDPNNDEA